jgi:hypothetical protein
VGAHCDANNPPPPLNTEYAAGRQTNPPQLLWLRFETDWLFCFVLFFVFVRRPAATRKQGFSGFLGKHFTCDDASALGLSDSWFYTWTKNAAQYKQCPTTSAAEFVPMINGESPCSTPT